MGAGTSPTVHKFFLCGNPRTFRQLCNGRRIFTKFDHEMYFGVPSRNPEIHLENFHFRGHLPPKSEIKSRSNRHLTQSTQQVRDALQRDTVYFRGPGSFRGRSTFLYDVRLRSYGASKLPNFRILAYFPHTKPLKRTFR